MPRYTVENTRTEKTSSHSTWSAAMRAAAKHDPHEVRIIETDRDGSREYNAEGKILGRDGHYH